MLEPSSVTCAVVLGVSASGKSAVSKALCEKYGRVGIYVDADDSHTEEAKAKMGRGEPLNDEDRAPWLVNVAKDVSHAVEGAESAKFDRNSTHRVVALACSALSKDLRSTLRRELEEYCSGVDVVFIHLDVPKKVIRDRLEAREDDDDHFFAGSEMADSQFDKLEPLEPSPSALVIDTSPGNERANSVEKTAERAWEFIEERRKERAAA